jgi:hypothetical protein
MIGNKRLTEQKDGQSDVDVRLNDELGGLLGGQTYVKAKDLTREVLLEYAKRQGAVTEVTLFQVDVQNFGGRTFSVTVDGADNTTRALKRAIADQEGFSVFSQQLFLLAKCGEKEEMSETPLDNAYLIDGPCTMALCVDVQGTNVASLIVETENGILIFTSFSLFYFQTGSGILLLLSSW